MIVFGVCWTPPRHHSQTGVIGREFRPSPASSGGGASGISPLRTSTISAPGKRASTACTRGSARTPVLSSAWRASFCDLTVALALFGRHHDHPAPVGPLRELSRQVVDQRLRARFGSSPISSRPSSQRTSRTSRFERELDAEVALLRGQRDQILETPDDERLAPVGSGADMRALAGRWTGRSAARGAPRVVSTREGSTRGASKRGADGSALRRGRRRGTLRPRAPARCRRASGSPLSGVGRSAA